MRILHVIATVDPNAGGPPLICEKLAIAQARLGHDVTIMAYEPSAAGRERYAAENGRTAGADRLSFHFLPPMTWPERVLGRHAAAACNRLVPGFDAVHLHGVWEPQLRVAAVAARRHHKPYLILLNGMLMPWAMARGTPKKRLAFLLGFRAMLDGGVLHCGSQDEVDAAAALGFTRASVIIPNGAFPDEYADLPPTGTFRAAHPELGDHPYILFVGRLHEQKGIDLLLAAFEIVARRHPTARLVIAGPDYGVALPTHSDRVLPVGPVYGRDKLAALGDAAAFCLPSRHEGFSLAVIEALACGIPVVLSTECHFPQVVTAGAGLVAPLDPPAIAEALLQVLADDRFRGVGKRMIAERYNWPALAAETIRAYQEAPGVHPGLRGAS
jgi:glycosyltransferase involved in cell wall biosynthesis